MRFNFCGTVTTSFRFPPETKDIREEAYFSSKRKKRVAYFLHVHSPSREGPALETHLAPQKPEEPTDQPDPDTSLP